MLQNKYRNMALTLQQGGTQIEILNHSLQAKKVHAEMDEIKPIPLEELKVISGKLGFDPETTIKDYYLTLLLFHLSKINGLYFKGGTALNKMLLNHARLSEDLDFTVKRQRYDKRKCHKKAYT